MPVSRKTIHLVASFRPESGGIYTYLCDNLSDNEDIYALTFDSSCIVQAQQRSRRVKPLMTANAILEGLRCSSITIHGLFSFYFVAYLLILRVLGSKASIRVYPHGMLYPSVLEGSNWILKLFWIFLFMNICKGRLTFVALSTAELEVIKKRCGKESVEVSAPKYMPRLDINQPLSIIRYKSCVSVRRFIVLARYAQEKQIIEIMKAFNRVESQSICLDIYGDRHYDTQYTDACEALHSELGDSRICLHGYIDGPELVYILSTSFCGIVFSVKENFSYSLLDFVQSSCVVIANENVGAASYFQNDSMIILKSYAAYEDLYDAISFVARMKASEYDAIVSRASRRFSEIFAK